MQNSLEERGWDSKYRPILLQKEKKKTDEVIFEGLGVEELSSLQVLREF